MTGNRWKKIKRYMLYIKKLKAEIRHKTFFYYAHLKNTQII